VPLAFQKLVHLGIRQRLPKLRVDLIELRKKINDGLHALLNDLAHRLARIQLRFLFEEAYREARRDCRSSLKFLIDTGENSQQ
jgi:hypothetical protein